MKSNSRTQRFEEKYNMGYCAEVKQRRCFIKGAEKKNRLISEQGCYVVERVPPKGSRKVKRQPYGQQRHTASRGAIRCIGKIRFLYMYLIKSISLFFLFSKGLISSPTNQVERVDFFFVMLYYYLLYTYSNTSFLFFKTHVIAFMLLFKIISSTFSFLNV